MVVPAVVTPLATPSMMVVPAVVTPLATPPMMVVPAPNTDEPAPNTPSVIPLNIRRWKSFMISVTKPMPTSFAKTPGLPMKLFFSYRLNWNGVDATLKIESDQS